MRNSARRYSAIFLSCFAVPFLLGSGCPPGPVGGECGGIDSACWPHLDCKYPAGLCDPGGIFGECVDHPITCPRDNNPVCGCDGQTYGNECEALRAGVIVDYPGACGEGHPCGGPEGFPCQEGEFCSFADGSCGATGQPGKCAFIAAPCGVVFDRPICGCDGRTYNHKCEANAAGVSVASEGECGSIVVRECGGLQGLECEAGEFCNYTGANCGAADELGFCEVIPEGCDDVFEPVCGCDGETYGNECEAHAVGASVASEGECP